jgi:peptidyl-prolyl cis-trans isomerase D
MIQVFEMEPGDVRVIPAGATVQIVRLDRIEAAEDTPELQRFSDGMQSEANQALASALFEAYMADAQRRASPQIDQRALEAVQTSIQTGGN